MNYGMNTLGKKKGAQFIAGPHVFVTEVVTELSGLRDGEMR